METLLLENKEIESINGLLIKTNSDLDTQRKSKLIKLPVVFIPSVLQKKDLLQLFLRL